jgi:hypothetical protein
LSRVPLRASDSKRLASLSTVKLIPFFFFDEVIRFFQRHVPTSIVPLSPMG